MQRAKCIYILVHLQLYALVLAASLRLPTLSPALFSSKPSNVTISFNDARLNSSKALGRIVPPDPCYYKPAGSFQILKFYDYGVQITAHLDVYGSLRKAEMDARNHDSEEFMGWWARRYASGDVRLLLHPGPNMTWGDWREAIWGFAEFVTHYQFLDMNFDVVQPGSALGTGILTVL